jgi:hypothetical protein
VPTVGNPALFDEDDEEVSLFDNSGLDNSDIRSYNSYIGDEDEID